MRSLSKSRAEACALSFALALLGCAGDGTSPTAPGSIGGPERLSGAAFVVRIDTRARSVQAVGRAPVSPGSRNGPSLSVLGTDAITLNVSNYSAEASPVMGSSRLRITFDVSITNRLPGIGLAPAGLSAVPDVLMLYPIVSIAATGNDLRVSPNDGTVLTGFDVGSGVLPSNEWNGNAPEGGDAWFDFTTSSVCPRPGPQCTRWEAFPPIAGGATSSTRRIGFEVESGVNYFQAQFMLLADLDMSDTPGDSLDPAPLPPPTPGVPFGPFGAWAGDATLQPNTEVFTGSHGAYTESNILPRIQVARGRGLKLLLALTGGARAQYLTDGAFDLQKWLDRMAAYDTPEIRQAIADAVADGTIVGNSVMDEPFNSGGPGNEENSWGPPGTMTKAKVDAMCRVVRDMFPTLPVGVFHDHDDFEPDKSYRECEFIISQYRYAKGPVTAFRDAALALGRRDNIAIAFSLNVLDGGIKNWFTGQCPEPATGGDGTYGGNCRMTAAQVREWGTVLGSAGCALLMWRYDETYMARSDNQQAFRDVAAHLTSLPGRRCSMR